MIQRIQSIYLFLATLFAVFFLSGNILKFSDHSGKIIGITIRGLIRISEERAPEHAALFLPLVLLILLIVVVSLLTIFLFKNRKLQLRLAIGLLILTILLVLLITGYSVYITGKYNADIVFEIKMILLLLMPICMYLAYRGIKKDDDLVKSYDRLR
jgi:cytochrome bd-type quinol oxidase subunit 2